MALIYVGLFGAAILGLFGYIYFSAVAHIRATADRDVAREHALLLRCYEQGGRSGLIAAIERRLALPLGARSYLLVDKSATVLAGNLSAWPAMLHGAAGAAEFRAPDNPQWAVRGEYRTLPDGSRLLVAEADADDGFVEAMAIGLAGAVAMIIVLAAAAGISTSRRSVSRIEAINATSREIMRSGLGKRIPLRGTGDEWDELAANLNSMLDRIEELVEANRQVSDNVAHDLRTPLTRMRGRLERASNRPIDPDRYQALLGDTIAELDAILKIFSSLLRISRIEAHEQTAGFRQIDLAALAYDVIELFEPTAEENGVTIALECGEPASILGDRDLLFDALSNLVDNAIRHGAGGVTIAIGGGVGEAAIAIGDHGPGIPEEERKNVVKRFYRLERSRNSPGSGLGLSLVAAVAHLHDAALAMADNGPGLRVELRFRTATGRAHAVAAASTAGQVAEPG